MNGWKYRLCFASLLACVGFLPAETPAALHLKVLALGERGVVEDLRPGDWSVKLEGGEAKVLAQRAPQEVGKEGQKWAFVFLPIRGVENRRVAIQAVATFMSTLPATDSVLVVGRTSKGLECFTPGFTTRPSLWEKALGRALAELPSRLEGRPESGFALPASPTGEKEEGMEPIQAFLAGLPARKLEQRADDMSIGRRGIFENYSPDSLASHTKPVAATLASLEQLGAAVARFSGEKHFVVFSRNEIDDLANPVWAKNVNKFSARDTLNTRLQVETMIRDVTLARISFSAQFAKLGLTLHSVSVGGPGYAGAFGEAALASGGYQYQFDGDLVARLPRMLPLWAARYDLEVPLPAGLKRPAKVTVESTRKNLRLHAPSLQ